MRAADSTAAPPAKKQRSGDDDGERQKRVPRRLTDYLRPDAAQENFNHRPTFPSQFTRT